jgi:uroporphyrinogen-III decarboxylase
MHDLELVKAYEPSVTEEYEQHIHQLVQNTRDYLGDDGIISLWAPGGAFNHASRLVNIEELYMLYLVDPEFYQELMRFCIERTHPWLEVMLSTDIDVLNIGGNVAGGFLGRENFERYIMGYEQEFIANLKATGKKINYHNCGSIMELLDSYKKLGMDIVEPVAPPPLGDGDLEEAVRIANGAYTLIGNIDQVNVIQKGTPGQIHKKVKEALAIGRDYPGFILQPADFLEYGTPRENVEAYVEAGLQQSSL